MKRFAYSGPAPQELFVAETERGYRVYVNEQQAIRWVEAAWKKSEWAKITRFGKEEDRNIENK